MPLLLLISLAEVEKTRCQLEREHLLGPADAQRPWPPGLFVPECDEHGHYAPTQCHGSTGYCWCVDRDGREVEGTRTRPGMRPPCKLEGSAAWDRPQGPEVPAGGPCWGLSWCFLAALNPDLLRSFLPFPPLQPPSPSPYHYPPPSFPLSLLTSSSSFSAHTCSGWMMLRICCCDWWQRERVSRGPPGKPLQWAAWPPSCSVLDTAATGEPLQGLFPQCGTVLLLTLLSLSQLCLDL